MKQRTKINLIRVRVAVTVFAAVAVVTAFWIGLGFGSRPVEVAAPEPTENSGRVYSTEIWDTGEVRIVTEQGYINQLSERTILITDRNLDEVQEELFDMIDTPEVEND